MPRAPAPQPAGVRALRVPLRCRAQRAVEKERPLPRQAEHVSAPGVQAERRGGQRGEAGLAGGVHRQQGVAALPAEGDRGEARAEGGVRGLIGGEGALGGDAAERVQHQRAVGGSV